MKRRVVLSDKVNGALIKMRHLIVYASVFCAFQLSARAATLLPSQEKHDLVTVKTCRDHEVLSSLKG